MKAELYYFMCSCGQEYSFTSNKEKKLKERLHKKFCKDPPIGAHEINCNGKVIGKGIFNALFLPSLLMETYFETLIVSLSKSLSKVSFNSLSKSLYKSKSLSKVSPEFSSKVEITNIWIGYS